MAAPAAPITALRAIHRGVQRSVYVGLMPMDTSTESTTVVAARLPNDVADVLHLVADAQGLTRSHYLRQLVLEAVRSDVDLIVAERARRRAQRLLEQLRTEAQVS